MRLQALTSRARALLPRGSSNERQAVALLPGLTLVAHHRPTSFEPSLQKPIFCLFLQGRKRASFGGQSYELGPGDCWVVSHFVPAVTRIREAPSLAIVLDLELGLLRSLHDEVEDAWGDPADAQAFQGRRVDPALAESLYRCLGTAGSPLDARVLGASLLREAHYRLVRSKVGGVLRDLLRTGSHASAVARAIARLRRDYREPLSMPVVARSVGMSPSLFYEQFKVITACTPLQFQKELRLAEARRLIGLAGASVADAAYDVGYQSPNQFSREYSRKFGVAPSEDARAARTVTRRRAVRSSES